MADGYPDACEPCADRPEPGVVAGRVPGTRRGETRSTGRSIRSVAALQRGVTLMSTVKESVEVDVPVSVAYNQWTQFEEFPNFMEGVEEIKQLDDRHNHWTTKIGGVRREFNTEIVDQLPDDRITWRVVEGDTRQRGSVRFERLDDTHTRVELTM